MIRLSPRLTVVATLALSLAAVGCSRDEPAPEKVAARPKPAQVVTRTATPVVVAQGDAFTPTVPPPSAPPEQLIKEALPAAGPVGTDFEAWKAGEAAFKHYATMNGFTEEATKSFFLKHIANNGDHYRLMMFGVLPGGPRYIAVKVYKDGRAEVLPDEM